MAEYTQAVASNNTDELLLVSFKCERAQFKDDGGLWREELEAQYMEKMDMKYIENEDLNGGRETWIKQVAAEQRGYIVKAINRVQLRRNNRCIKMRHKPPEGKTRNKARNGRRFTEKDINYSVEPPQWRIRQEEADTEYMISEKMRDDLKQERMKNERLEKIIEDLTKVSSIRNNEMGGSEKS
jgi:hypothetical protein